MGKRVLNLSSPLSPYPLGILTRARGLSTSRGAQSQGSAPASPGQRSLVGLQVPSARLQRGQHRPQVNYSCCTTAESACTRCHGEETATSKCLARGKPILWLLTPRWALGLSTLSQLILGRDEKCTSDPFQGIAFAVEGSGFLDSITAVGVQEPVGRAGAGEAAARGGKELEGARALWQRCQGDAIARIWGKDFLQAEQRGVMKPAWTEDAASASCSTDVQL